MIGSTETDQGDSTAAPGDPAGAPEADGAEPVPIQLVPSSRVEDAKRNLAAAQARWVETCGFEGRLGQVVHIPGKDGRLDRVLFGWGDDQARRRGRFHLGDFARRATPGAYRLDADLEPEAAEEAALGWSLGRYRYGRYKKTAVAKPADLRTPDGVDPIRLGHTVDGVFLTRDLINTPAADMGPEALEAAARDVADRHGAAASAIVGDDLLEANFPMIHAVGRAASQAPRLIDIAWGASDAPKVTLVGKGVCFDTGGLNLKIGRSMALMKKDMGGAATVLGLAHMIMATALKVRLRVLIPAVENAVSATSFRPGDVLTSRAGRTVEIGNTDAEGRLVLADALALATEENPDLIVDMATLTGAARVALGADLAPFYTDDEDLAADVAEAGRATADPVWRMPLWPGYERDIEPDIADLDNAPGGGMAGSITAALFLRRFVGACRWAHFDIYGWTPSARPGRPKGGECQAARALFRVIEDRYGRSA